MTHERFIACWHLIFAGCTFLLLLAFAPARLHAEARWYSNAVDANTDSAQATATAEQGQAAAGQGPSFRRLRLEGTGIDATPVVQSASSQDSNSSGLGANAQQAAGSAYSPAGDEPLPQPVAISHSALEKRTPLAPPSQTGRESSTSAPGSARSLVSVGSSLILVIGVFLGLAWCYRRATSGAVNRSLPANALGVIGRISIAPRQQLVLVQFGPKLVLLSHIQGEVRALSEIEEPAEVEQLLALCTGKQPGQRQASSTSRSQPLAFPVRNRHDYAAGSQHSDQLSENDLRSYRAILEQGASL